MRTGGILLLLWMGLSCAAGATPANRAALEKHFGRFLPKRLNACVTCHLPAKLSHPPASLQEFPHNPFGDRLAKLGRSLPLARRIQAVAAEDSDSDGFPNEAELLLGFGPGDAGEKPAPRDLKRLPALKREHLAFLTGYRWEPFEPVRRPPIPAVPDSEIRNAIDSFIAAQLRRQGIRPRPEAPRRVLIRRLYLDLTGLAPTPEEVKAFESDRSDTAYEKLVDRLLASPRYGERWGRHFMDIWRYSDWAGWMEQVRDSKPHIWRWRDWIVESLNADRPYDRMVQEMLAADELAPEDTDALRATGFLARNFKLLSREQWMEDVVGHTSRAFLGITMNCARCHDHMYDPFTQEEYYRLRAIFEPHNVRTDRVPGEPDINKNGLVRAFDSDTKAVTYFYPRGDERNPDKSRAMAPGVPTSLGGTFAPEVVRLPRLAHQPHKRPFEVEHTLTASEQALAEARKAALDAPPAAREPARLALEAAEARHRALLAVLDAERAEDASGRDSEEWRQAARAAVTAQRAQAAAEARLNLHTARSALAAASAKAESPSGEAKEKALQEADAARKKQEEAEKALAAAEADLAKPPSTEFKPRAPEAYPAESTGRRLAFARWITDPRNPLAARVAVNHLWARHFARGIVPTVDDFGRNGRPPSHPELLDWLACELMNSSSDSQRWSLKRIHRLIVTSAAYRRDSRLDAESAAKDPDNVYLWRFPSKRLEAELVRDNLLHAAGALELTMGGPEIDHRKGLESRRRSLYLRTAPEKQVEFMQIFDGPSPTECYARKQSVMPQQALALANSELALAMSRLLARSLSDAAGADARRFVTEAFWRILCRPPDPRELKVCAEFLARQVLNTDSAGSAQREEARDRARRNLLLVLFNHTDFVTVR